MSIEIVAWRSWNESAHNFTIWQQKPTESLFPNLEALVRYEDHQKEVDELKKQVQYLQDVIDERAP